jgi:hypothetical protein
MIKRLDITSAETFAYVPDNMPPELLYRFGTGGIYPFDKSLLLNSPALVPVQNDARPVAINFILQYLEQNKERCYLFEEPNRIPSDPWVKSSQIKYVHLDKEMYYFFGGNGHAETFGPAFKTSEGYYFLCALSSLPTGKQNAFSNLSSLTTEQLNDFTSNVVSFFVKAYDGEGYLQWSKEVQAS